MQIEDSERKEIGSDHNLLWCKVRPGNLEKVVFQDRYKWRIDGKCDWEEYQDAVMAEFTDWDTQLGEKDHTKIEEQDGMSSRKPGGSGRGISQALGGVGKKARE